MEFTTIHPFTLVNKTSRTAYHQEIINHRYSFYVPTVGTYIVDVEEYPHLIHAVKFHLKSHSSSDQKYNHLVGKNKAPTTIGTCFHLIRHIHDNNRKSSFTFIGSNSVGESKSNTKRYRVYKRIADDILGPERFTHHTDDSRSMYLMISRDVNVNEAFIIQRLENIIDLHFFDFDQSP